MRVFLLKSVIISVYFIWVNTIDQQKTTKAPPSGWIFEVLRVENSLLSYLVGATSCDKKLQFTMDSHVIIRSHASPNPTWKNFIPSNSTIPYLIISLLENFPKRSMVNPPCRSTNPRLFPVSTPVSTIGVFKVAATASAKLPIAMHAALKSHPKKMMTWGFHL